MATRSAVLSSPTFSPRALAHSLQYFLNIRKHIRLLVQASRIKSGIQHLICLLMAGSRGVEPHPVSENPVFKAGRRTNPAALLPKGTRLMHLVFPFVYAHNTYCAALSSASRLVCMACSRLTTSSEPIQMSLLCIMLEISSVVKKPL